MMVVRLWFVSTAPMHATQSPTYANDCVHVLTKSFCNIYVASNSPPISQQ